jgi:hypothetical protein
MGKVVQLMSKEQHIVLKLAADQGIAGAQNNYGILSAEW